MVLRLIDFGHEVDDLFSFQAGWLQYLQIVQSGQENILLRQRLHSSPCSIYSSGKY